jgi:PAS domain S-box-containing protein
LREAQAIAQLGSWTLDLATGELAWSDEIFRILGMRPGSVEPTLDFFFSLVHPQDLAAVRQELEAAYLRPDGRYSIAHRVLARDGVERYIRERGCVRFDADGCPLGISGTALDITERMRAEGDLLQRERLERGLLDLSALFLKPSGLGMDGLINQALARMGELTATDRAYLFSSDSERRAFSNTHEWTAPGIAPVIHMLVRRLMGCVTPESAPARLPAARWCFPAWRNSHRTIRNGRFLESQGIRSLLLVPVMQGDVSDRFRGLRRGPQRA